MKVIQTLNLNNLNNLEILDLCRKICDIVCAGDSETARKCVAELCKAADDYAQSLEGTPELISMEIHATDYHVDMAWRGMNAELENHLEHPNETVRNASAAVYEIWQRTEDPTEMSYEEEYKALNILISRIAKIPADIMKTAGVDEWFDALRNRYNEFMTLWGEKTVTDTQRVANQIKKNRSTVENLYAEVVDFIDNWSKFAELDDKFNEIDGEVAKVVTSINEVISEYNAMIADRRKNVSACIQDILNDIQ